MEIKKINKKVVELAYTAKGNWKVFEDGSRVELTDEEWRVSLSRVLGHTSVPPSASGLQRIG